MTNFGKTQRAIHKQEAEFYRYFFSTYPFKTEITPVKDHPANTQYNVVVSREDNSKTLTFATLEFSGPSPAFREHRIQKAIHFRENSSSDPITNSEFELYEDILAASGSSVEYTLTPSNLGTKDSTLTVSVGDLVYAELYTEQKRSERLLIITDLLMYDLTHKED